MVLGCLCAAGYLGVEARDAKRVERGNELARAGDYAGALREAATVRGAPAEVRALLLEANALFAARRYRAASRAFAALAKRDPNNWVVHAEWARVLVALGRQRAVRARYDRARQLNPNLPRPPGVRAEPER